MKKRAENTTNKKHMKHIQKTKRKMGDAKPKVRKGGCENVKWNVQGTTTREKK